MAKKKETNLISQKRIEDRIFLIRGKKVMLDKDLAELYEVETKVLIQAVKRNIERFPEDFMFQLTKEEVNNFLRSQFVTLKRGQHFKYLPYVFTEYGVVMLSSVLKSKRAIRVNIQIVETFVKLREMIISNKVLRERIDELERKYDKQFKIIFDVIRDLITEKEKPKSSLGFIK